MEITSSGSPGPRPEPELDHSGHQLHAELPGAPPPAALAAAFRRAGWSARASAWDEFEVAETWAELRLSSFEGASRLTGTIFRDRLRSLLDLLGELGVACAGELYDPGGVLVSAFDTRANA